MINDPKKIKVTKLNVSKDRRVLKRHIEKAKTFTFEAVVPYDEYYIYVCVCVCVY